MSKEELDYDIKCIFDKSEPCWRQKERAKYMSGFAVRPTEIINLLFCVGCKLTDIDGLLSDWYKHNMGTP